MHVAKELPAGRGETTETHRLAELKQKQMAALRGAMGITEDVNEGDAFNQELQEQKRAAKKEEYERRKQEQEQEQERREEERRKERKRQEKAQKEAQKLREAEHLKRQEACPSLLYHPQDLWYFIHEI